MSLVPAIISTVSNLGSNIANSVFSYKAQKSANNTNVALAKYQNDWNLAQWNRENEYNHPLNQMKRLGEAGLNPNLVYNNGATTVAARSPQAASAHVDPAAFQVPITAMSQQYLAMEQLRLQEKATDANVALTAARAQGIIQDNEWKVKTMSDRVRQENLKRLIDDQVLGIREHEANVAAMNDNIVSATKQAAVELAKIQPKLADAQLRRAEQEIKLNLMRFGLDSKKAAAYCAQAGAMVRNLSAQARRTGFDAESLKMDNDFFKKLGGKGEAGMVMKSLGMILKVLAGR